MPNHVGHPMLAQMTHDEAARDSFVLSLKQHISADVGPGTVTFTGSRCFLQ